MTLEVLDHFGLRRLGPIEVERNSDGEPIESMPQSRYENRGNLDLNRHGHGPFCRLVMPPLPLAAGVYAIEVADEIMYVGEAQNLRERFGARGYAVVHPRNCFTGGQPTNCKINARILETHRNQMVPWLHLLADVEDRKALERTLIDRIGPPWNG